MAELDLESHHLKGSDMPVFRVPIDICSPPFWIISKNFWPAQTRGARASHGPRRALGKRSCPAHAARPGRATPADGLRGDVPARARLVGVQNYGRGHRFLGQCKEHGANRMN